MRIRWQDLGRRLLELIRDVIAYFRARKEKRRAESIAKRKEIEDEVAKQTDTERRRDAHRWVRPPKADE